MKNDVPFDEETACDACGKFGAYVYGDRRLCGDCYQTNCSCCPEFQGAEQDGSDPLPKPLSQDRGKD
jgi:hypothetical protein